MRQTLCWTARDLRCGVDRLLASRWQLRDFAGWMCAAAPCTMTGVHGFAVTKIMTGPNEALRTILPIAGWGDRQAVDVTFTGGADPVLPTPFRIGAAGAATLAASGLGATEP